ncbi:MAG: hypothetical protein K2M89_03155 [Clostridiales bacterium]|nr:hypothetical protein [Clostridiales bacterium]
MNDITNDEQVTLVEEPQDGQNPQDADKPETPPQPQDQKEEIKFQRIMNYKAYRRGMLMFRLGIATALAVGLAFTCFISLFFGIVLPVVVYIFATISILFSINNEQTYNVYTTRVVLKRRGDDGRKSVPFDRIVSVEYKSAFYEKRGCTGTVTIKAKDDNGKIKKYKMKHILDYKPIVAYINESINRRKTDGGQD